MPTGGPPPKTKRTPGPLFRGFGAADTEYVARLQEYGREYKEWLLGSLAEWVASVTEAESTGAYMDRIWIGNPDHEGLTDYYDENPIGWDGKQGDGPYRVPWGGDKDYWYHKGAGHWQYVPFKLSDEQKALVNFYYRWRNWWKRWNL